MINGLLWLLGAQLVGEVLVRLLGVPVPGPVVGMVLLVIVLGWRRPAPEAGVFRAADGLLTHMQLLFIPAAVGAMAHLDVVLDHPLPILGAAVVSWCAGLATVALLGSALLRLTGVPTVPSGASRPGDVAARDAAEGDR